MDIIYTAPTWAVIVTGLAVAALVAGVVAWRTVRDDYSGSGDVAVWGSIAFVTVAVVAVGIPMAMRESTDYVTWCEAQGGHVNSSTTSAPVTTVNGNGQVGVGVATSTTTYCLTADGRILDVQ